MTLELLRRKLGIPSKVVALFVNEEVEASPRPDLMRSSYDFLKVIPESSRMTYWGDSGGSDYWGLLSDWFDNGEAADFMIVDTVSGILLIVPQTSES